MIHEDISRVAPRSHSRKSIYLLLLILAVALSCVSFARAQKTRSLASEATTAEEFYAGVRSGAPLSRIDSVLATVASVVRNLPSLGGQLQVEGKCFTEYVQLASNSPEINPKLKREILSEPQNQDSVVSPKGYFTIYFDRTGTGAATQAYVDSIANMSDRAYEFEVLTLGYPKPPFTSDSTYHTHIVEFGLRGIYGLTDLVNTFDLGGTPSGLMKGRTFNEIDNDFTEPVYATHGYDAARVTVFHEFQHVIQYGSYGVYAGTDSGPDGFAVDGYFKEMTAVWMETFSNGDVKDYLQYPSVFLKSIALSINGGVDRGYGQAIWFQYLEKTFGYQIIQDIWSKYNSVAYNDPFHAPVFATQTALRARGSSFCSEYMRFGTALFFTGRRFTGKSIFPDAQLFPIDSLNVQLTTPGSLESIQNGGAVPASINYIYTGFGTDTVVVVLARDTNYAIQPSGTVSITSSNSFVFLQQDSLLDPFCDTIAGFTGTTAEAFPQPFVVKLGSTNSLSVLASSQAKPVDVQLDIYSMNFVRIAHIDKPALPFADSYYAVWNGEDDIGKLVPTGIYLYTINTDGNRRQGKIAVVRGK